MKKLWQKNWQLNAFIESFETKDDFSMDQKLVKADVLQSIAHAKMLCKIGILSKSELSKLTKALILILDLNGKGKFTLSMGEEDIHTKIENFLTKEAGNAGKKIHTARSRNDQVITATRLFTKEELLAIWKGLLDCIKSLVAFAKKYEFVPMPGYTHMQKAMPSSLGVWAGSFAQNFLDDLSVLKTAFAINNQSPLGSAAGFGVPLAIDRKYTAQLLGFEKVQENVLAVQSARGKIEANIVSSLISILSTINKLATDVLLYTTAEFNYFTVSQSLLTGSSMLPQKRNVDVAELLRSKVHIVLGNYTALVSLSSNLPSGYNRDLQDSKKPLFDSFEIAKGSLYAANVLIKNITPNVEVLEKSMTAGIFATHKAIELVKKGMPFRQAYQKVGRDLQNLSTMDVDNSLKQSTHIGATGNLGLKKLIKMLAEEQKMLKKEKKEFEVAVTYLINGGGETI